MEIDLLSWFINLSTFIVFTSPFLLIINLNLVLFTFLFLSISFVILTSHFSSARSKSSHNQFENLTIAHRGGHPVIIADETENFPENTISAFRWAANHPGIDAIEFDVWLSKDNIPMVNHDGYLAHTFVDCHEFISSLTCAELKKLKYLKKNQNNLDLSSISETMPTLEEVIKLVEPTKLKLMIEIKEMKKVSEMAKVIHQSFERYPFLYERAYCAAFYPYNLYAIRRLNPLITTALLSASNMTARIIANTEHTPRPVPVFIAKNMLIRSIIDGLFTWFRTTSGLKFLGADLLCIERGEISENLLDTYKQKNIIVCVWCVNDLEQKKWLQGKRATIITDILFDQEKNT